MALHLVATMVAHRLVAGAIASVLPRSPSQARAIIGSMLWTENLHLNEARKRAYHRHLERDPDRTVVIRRVESKTLLAGR